MSFVELIILAAGLSMDAFAVSICKGLGCKKCVRKTAWICGLWFGFFQAAMPLAGYLLGSIFADAIAQFDHWVAFFLLAVIGLNMLKEAWDNGEPTRQETRDIDIKTMFLLALATSVDALAVGISLAMVGNEHIVVSVMIIGAVTFCFSAAGVKIGNLFGMKFEKKAQIAGGMIMILLGLHILIEHLGGIG